MLRKRTLVPPLSIHLPDGRAARVWDYKQKKNLVIVFVDAGCSACERFLEQLAARSAELRAKDAIVLSAFLEAPPARLTEALPPEILAGADVTGRGARGFLGDDALSARGLERRGVFVTDRYGELVTPWLVRGHEFPASGEILASIDLAEMSCDACGAPAWPPE